MNVDLGFSRHATTTQVDDPDREVLFAQGHNIAKGWGAAFIETSVGDVRSSRALKVLYARSNRISSIEALGALRSLQVRLCGDPLPCSSSSFSR